MALPATPLAGGGDGQVGELVAGEVARCQGRPVGVAGLRVALGEHAVPAAFELPVGPAEADHGARVGDGTKVLAGDPDDQVVGVVVVEVGGAGVGGRAEVLPGDTDGKVVDAVAVEVGQPGPAGNRAEPTKSGVRP